MATLVRSLPVLLLVAGLCVGGVVSAQDRDPLPRGLAVYGGRAAMRLVPKPANTPTPVPTREPTATPKPEVSVRPTRNAVLLGPMTHDYQRMNNCGPVAVLMTLSYYGQQHAQSEVAYALRPSPDDVSVSSDEAARYVRDQGLHALVRLGGTPSLLRELLSNNIPVMTPHLLNTEEDIGHFTVIRGYDQGSDTLIINDSYYGPERYVPVEQYMKLWEPYERTYMPVYTAEQEPIVRAILGADWDESENAYRYVAQQRGVVARDPNTDTWMSLGYGLYRAGEYGEALAAYENAVEYGLSKRVLWYTAWPSAALNELGRHTEALRLADSALAQNLASSEALLERGNALRGLGRYSEAYEAYRLASRYAPYLLSAQVALEQSQ